MALVIALYRVPEPQNNISSPLSDETLQQLWKITMHNFTPTPAEAAPPSDWDLVVMNHRPQFDPEASPSIALPNFVHPQNALYMIGPNGRSMVPEDIPQYLRKVRRHHVHIPTDSRHSMWGHVVWSLLYWDRMMKAACD